MGPPTRIDGQAEDVPKEGPDFGGLLGVDQRVNSRNHFPGSTGMRERYGVAGSWSGGTAAGAASPAGPSERTYW